MNASKIAELKELAGKATPATWSIHLGFDRYQANPGCYGAYLEVDGYYNVLISAMPEKDRKFLIAANPTTVLELCDEVERLREALKAAQIALRGGTHLAGVFWRENADDEIEAALKGDGE